MAFVFPTSLAGIALPALAESTVSDVAASPAQAFAWGYNECPYWVGVPFCYQAALENLPAVPSPTPLAGFDDVIEVAAGDFDSTMVRSDGSVWSWGFDALSGVVGEPRQIFGISDVVDIAVGGNLYLALRSDATVWSWGGPFPGDGSTGYVSTPVQVLLPSPAISVSAGSIWGQALLGDGTIWSWGGNGAGTLGDGTYFDRPTPAQSRASRTWSLLMPA